MKKILVGAVALSCLAGQASALNIVRNINGAGASGSQAGGGGFASLINAAADLWQVAIQDTHTVTIDFSWDALGSGTLGVHNLVSQGGSPNRETGATIRFTNVSSIDWFMDSTPMNSSEYGTYTESSANLGGGTVNTGRHWTGGTGDASGRYDFFSVALHEIGHALGLSSANTSFTVGQPVTVTAPRPFAGSVIPTVSGAHLNIGSALMYPFFNTGERKCMSAADILANAEISKFSDLNLDPCAVPEPASMAVLGLGALAAIRRKRSK